MELIENLTFEEQLNNLVINLNWRKIILLSENVTLEEKIRFSWAWPNEKTLKMFELYLKSVNIVKILSIGCGTGLLEWIIQQSCGIEMSGLEIDKNWWTSNYSPRTFIPLNYTESDIKSEFLLNCVSNSFENILNTDNQWNFALMFCYFNNGEAFRSYVKYYKGDFIIIIGPKDGAGIHTDPLPFSPIFNLDDINGNNLLWKLDYSLQIGNSYNYIVVYKKNKIY